MESKDYYEKLYKDGCFPFIQLIGGEFQQLGNIYKSSKKFNEEIEKFLESFNDSKIDLIINKWWKNKFFKEKEEIPKAGVEAYLQNTSSGYINCIKTLYTEIEGIIGYNYLEEKKGKTKIPKLLRYLEEKAKSRFFTINSLGFPQAFYEYLKEVIFQNFDIIENKKDLSRHSASHGFAKSEDYTKMKALQAILVLDQIYFYLA
ncbi:MAG: hypothetical protein ACTSRP_21125 [Candidatus Helarchaeota archaeon]